MKLTWRFEAFEGYRWIFEGEDSQEYMVIRGKFTPRGDSYFEASAGLFKPDTAFATLSEAVKYIEQHAMEIAP
jgi:hypothetical protein